MMSSLYFSTKSFMELLSKIASLSCLTGPSSRLASAKVRTFLLPAKSFLKYFCRAKSPDSGTRGLSPLFSSGCGVLPPTAFFALFLWRGLQTSTFHPYPPNLFAKILRIYAAQHALEVEIRKEEVGFRNCRPAEGGGGQQRTAAKDGWRRRGQRPAEEDG